MNSNTDRKSTRATAVLAALVLSLAAAPAAHAIDTCRVKVDKKTGVILADATNVVGTLLWGEAAGQENNAFFNAGTCVAAGKAKKCQIANPATLASKSPPADCTLYMDDGTAACQAWIPGCTPSPREGTGAVVNDSTGARIGYMAEPYGQFLVHDASGVPVRLYVNPTGSGFEPNGQVYTLASDCSGTPLMVPDASMIKSVSIATQSVGYHGPSLGTMQNIQASLNYGSFFTSQGNCDAYFGMGLTTHVPPSGCCYPFAFVQSMGNAVPINLGAFVPPFSLELQ